MALLLDTDAFCKLGSAGLLQPAVQSLGVTMADCARLPALPHMLSRGRLAKRLGPALTTLLLPIAAGIPAAPSASPAWLNRTVQIPGIDPGEAQLLARAAESADMFLTGDKRALRAVKDVTGFPEALAGRVITLEAVLFELCTTLGEAAVQARVAPMIALDTVVGICFSPGGTPRVGLRSYLADDIKTLQPLLPWMPTELR